MTDVFLVTAEKRRYNFGKRKEDVVMSSLQCSRCGSENLDLLVNDADDEVLLCTECGHEQASGS